MYKFVSALLIVLVVGKLQYSNVTGYKWIPHHSGNHIPRNAIFVDKLLRTYVGRAIHYNLVLPAEVNRTHALIYDYDSNEISKTEFDILVTTSDGDHCEWRNNSFDILEKYVHAGNAWNNEPIYIGKMHKDGHDPSWTKPSNHIASILLSSYQIYSCRTCTNEKVLNVLICNHHTNWTDAKAGNIPKNAISGGRSEEDYEMFVARLMGPISAVPGQVVPALNVSWTVYGNDKDRIQSTHCQVLIGEPNEYSWRFVKYGAAIPDYAVVGGRSEKKELLYVARFYRRLGYIVFSEIHNFKSGYEILVKNCSSSDFEYNQRRKYYN